MNYRILHLVISVLLFPVLELKAEDYTPTAHIGEFLKRFEKAYRAGDKEWIRSAVDRAGIIEQARDAYFGLLGPNDNATDISGLSVSAAPEGYILPNSLLDIDIEPTIPVDFILTFKRQETTFRIPAGYRDGKIWLVGIKKK